jgi:uncharacterized protein
MATNDDQLGEPSRGSSRLKLRSHYWFRWLHVYSSMICFVVVLFFAVTGITLNHPDWTFGDEASTAIHRGTLPNGWNDNGTVDFLAISEFVRNDFEVRGAVKDYEADTRQGSISFASAGYAADILFDVPSGEYTLTITQQGVVAVMNDLHKGRDTGSGWSWVIDIAGGLLALISITGLALQFFLRKRRRRALTAAVLGAALIVVLGVITIY